MTDDTFFAGFALKRLRHQRLLPFTTSLSFSEWRLCGVIYLQLGKNKTLGPSPKNERFSFCVLIPGEVARESGMMSPTIPI